MSWPQVATERLGLTSSGHVRYALKTPSRDGTTHIVVEPLDFMARLANELGAAPEARVRHRD